MYDEIFQRVRNYNIQYTGQKKRSQQIKAQNNGKQNAISDKIKTLAEKIR